MTSKKRKRTPRMPLKLGFELHTALDVIRAGNMLNEWVLEGKLDNRDLGAINGNIRNMLTVMIPKEPMQITQQLVTGPTPDQIILSFIENLPSELKNAVIAHARTKMAATAPSTT